MKTIAVISDVHANFEALSAVMDDGDFRAADIVIFCGDALGYYYDSEKVVCALADIVDVGVRGNHDRIFLEMVDDPNYSAQEYERKYGRGLGAAQSELSSENLAWIRSLPEKNDLTVDGRRLLVCHGSPFDPDEYVYPDCPASKQEDLFALGYDCVLYGHTHYPTRFQRETKLVINPGSVGQPRDQGGYAAWALLRVASESISVELRKTYYDVSRIEKLARELDPGLPYLANVLRRK